MRILGIDPGLRSTGWGLIAVAGGRLRHVANGAIQPPPQRDDGTRLKLIFEGLGAVIADHRPDHVAIEQIFVAKSAGSALRLGMARGAAILATADAGLAVTEIAARAVKKAVVGSGSADKVQIQEMIRRLLLTEPYNADAADALAIAIAASNDAGKAVAGGVELGSGGKAGGLSAAIAAALAREDAGKERPE